MTDTYSQLKDELSVLYPDITDAELNEMTNNLIQFFTISVKAVYEADKVHSPLTDIDVTNSEQHFSKQE